MASTLQPTDTGTDRRDVPPAARVTTATRAWRGAYWTLTGLILVTAALNMLRLRGGFLTNHAADVVVPAWLYVVTRGLAHPGRRTRLTRIFGWSPHVAGASVFVGSAATEISQYFWPHGIFRGWFDPWDLVSYAVGVGVCWALDVWARAR